MAPSTLLQGMHAMRGTFSETGLMEMKKPRCSLTVCLFESPLTNNTVWN